MNYDYYTNELFHHGVLGQKWGIRRYQKKDGTLTEAGKQKYRTERFVGDVGRAITNTSLGQRILGVGTNRGYREDKAEIKSLYKEKRDKIKNATNKTKDEMKAELKSLKEDYKKTKGEARVSAAEALYQGQTTKQNEKIQTQKLGKQFAKSFLAGGYGALRYDRLTAEGQTRGKAATHAALTNIAELSLNYLTQGIASGAMSAADYAFYGSNKDNPHKQKYNIKK